MNNAAQIRNWLICQPRPASIKLSGEGEPRTIVIKSWMSWARTATTVAALNPDLIEAYDENGELIRAANATQIEGPEDAVDNNPCVPSLYTASSTKNAQPFDPETQRFELFAKLLGEAYERVAEAHKFSTQVAFDKMVDLFAAVNRRSESLEKSLDGTHKLLRRAWQDSLEQAVEQAKAGEDGEGGFLGDLVKSYVSSAVAGGAPTPTNGKAKA